MSDIENISEQLSAYLDGELTRSEARRVAAALAENPELTAELEELRKTRSFLRDLPRRCAGDDFAAKVLQEANSRGLVGRPGAAVRRRGPARWLRYCAAAAIVLVALGTGVVVSLSLYDKMGRSPVVIRDKELIGEVAREFYSKSARVG